MIEEVLESPGVMIHIWLEELYGVVPGSGLDANNWIN